MAISHSNIPSSKTQDKTQNTKQKRSVFVLFVQRPAVYHFYCTCMYVCVHQSVSQQRSAIVLHSSPHTYTIKQGCNKMNLINKKLMSVIQSSYCYYQNMSACSVCPVYLVRESDSSTHAHTHTNIWQHNVNICYQWWVMVIQTQPSLKTRKSKAYNMIVLTF